MGADKHDHQKIKDELAAIAGHCGLRLDPHRMELNETGMDFRVAFATDYEGTDWVLRSPRRPDVWERAENEHKALLFIRDKLPIDVPNWRIVTRELIAYPLLNGTPVATVDPSGGGYLWQQDQQALPDVFFDSLAEALAALHGIDQDAAAKAGIRIKGPDEARKEFSSNIEDIKHSLAIPSKVQERWDKWLSTDSYWPEHSTINHGDLHPPHILVDPSQRVTGFIDWSEAEGADPGKDFTIYLGLFGPEGLRDLLQRYERFGGQVWPRMHEHIVEQWAAYPALVAKFALLAGDDAVMELAKGMITELEHDLK
ncbi:hypothetical protein DCC85_10625 [Paenibacillus sp. CAA11]|uniref:macrolide 2'-phosphotransferase n=1 Tax=Paenibacillus sp. CAA11 TaxID=1532905 RepID=UPI000D356CB1|nr:macrolide 2'-phosphotransferase [Paenibacillus sp. CAA11]AWB44632.1 hypothetical protein DCC85_10625 [Paenibacillus sp. CAA11]